VLGRELGVTWYGLGGNDEVIAPPEGRGQLTRVIRYKSRYFDLPILEYRPYRAFSANQSSVVLFQLFAGIDVPYSTSIVTPPGASSDLDPVWSAGLRMVFDWRYYP
jgi:hypothetical protein